MLNTGLRTGELLGLLNNDIDLEHRVMHLQRGVKEVSKRDVPLNDAAIEAIKNFTPRILLRRKHAPSCATTAVTSPAR